MNRWWCLSLVAGLVGCASRPAASPPTPLQGPGEGSAETATTASVPGGVAPVSAALPLSPNVERGTGGEVWTRASLARRAREREPALGALVQRARARQAEAAAAGALPAPMAMAQLWQALVQ